MGTTDITMLHALGRGELALSPTLEAESPSLGDSSMMADGDGDQLRAMPPPTAPELPNSGDGLYLSERFLHGAHCFY
jgi:hypothetical protein